ncbi:hypothetical protein AB0A71_20115 [Kitasatospora aureofaciens]|uniref:hypothetical protein n=1 Tax=Kitasatospora aureofaciens TaxID=1894 RepID=UPI0033FCDEB6
MGPSRPRYGTRPWTVPGSTTQDGLPVRFTTTQDALYVHFLGPVAGETVVTDLHLPQDTRATELASGAPVPVEAGHRGAVFTLPRRPNRRRACCGSPWSPRPGRDPAAAATPVVRSLDGVE